MLVLEIIAFFENNPSNLIGELVTFSGFLIVVMLVTPLVSSGSESVNAEDVNDEDGRVDGVAELVFALCIEAMPKIATPKRVITVTIDNMIFFIKCSFSRVFIFIMR